MTGSFKTLKRILNMGKPTTSKIFLGLILMAVGYLTINPACKNPNDFKPPEDTLVFPPLPPRLLSPVDRYAFITDGIELSFRLEWEPVDSADTYILELTLNGHPNSIALDSNSYEGGVDSDHFGTNTWRVRVSSSRWKGSYTEWTETRIFYTRNRPQPPYLYQPPYDTSLSYDSMPAPVGFSWGTVTGAHFYNVEIYKDHQPIYCDNPDQCLDTIYVDDTGHYEWRVRATSDLWQLPGQWSDLWPFAIGLRKTAGNFLKFHDKSR